LGVAPSEEFDQENLNCLYPESGNGRTAYGY